MWFHRPPSVSLPRHAQALVPNSGEEGALTCVLCCIIIDYNTNIEAEKGG